MIEALGHSFRPYGGEEMICRRCDFVVWPCETPEQAVAAILSINGSAKPCPYNPRTGRTAQAIEARRAETENTGSVEDESAVPTGCAQSDPAINAATGGQQ
jgi:hypothetical protein